MSSDKRGVIIITVKEGNILSSDAIYICHQVNCQGAMRSGVAKVIRERYPKVYTEYMEVGVEESIGFGDFKFVWTPYLGHIQLVDVSEEPNSPKFVINMFAQEKYGYDNKRYTSYDAFWNCLNEIVELVPVESKIAFPWKIGCVRGGANWGVIYKMIETVFMNKNIDVELWRYDDGEELPRV